MSIALSEHGNYSNWISESTLNFHGGRFFFSGCIYIVSILFDAIIDT